MARLTLKLLGPWTAAWGGEPVPGSDEARALLAYLAVEAHCAHRREALGRLLWPGLSAQAADDALRGALSEFAPFVLVSGDSVQFDLASDHWLDVAAFDKWIDQACVGQGTETGASTLECLQRALELYQGEFLEGFSPGDRAALGEWVLRTRDKLHRQAVQGLERLADLLAQQGSYEQAQACARRQIELEPWREQAHRQLMRLLALGGQPAAALAQYEACRRVLVEELGVEVAEETSALYRQICDGELYAARVSPVSAIPLPACPYRGLFAFREQDAPFFFGREVFSERLVEMIHRQALVAVIGPSGGGKSSVVFAGLLPRVRREGWLVVECRPGNRPLHALAAALVARLEPGLSEVERLPSIQTMAQALGRRELGLRDVAERILAAPPGPAASTLLLVVDQFEELYSLCLEAHDSRRFMDELLAGVGASPTPARLRVVLTLRADFMGQALAYRPFADALQGAALILGPMSRQELGRAIENPARQQGVLFEAGLTTRILDDVGDEPGKLPLLQFALTALWGRQSGGQLTHAAYEAIGRVEGALASYADQVYAGLGQAEQERARRIFVQMVRPGEGTEDTRCLATRADVGEDDWALVSRLADARLVVTDYGPGGQETAEIVHEALIRVWSRLQAWMDIDRAFRSWEERLRAVRRQWQVSGKDNGVLLRGAPLAEAEEWLRARGVSLGAREHEFVQASVELRKREAQAAEEARRRELDQARALAAEQKRRAEIQVQATARLRWLAAGLALMFLLAVGAAIFARGQQQEAERQARLADARQLAAQAKTILDKHPQRSLLLALEALTITLQKGEARVPVAEQALREALARMGGRNLSGHSGRVVDVAISPDGRWIATGSTDRTVRVWAWPGGEPVVLAGHAEAVHVVVFSPDGRWLATGSGDGAARLWTTGKWDAAPIVLADHEGAVLSMAIDPGSHWLATGGADAAIRLWDLEQPTLAPRVLAGHQDGITRVAFSRDGQRLASGCADGSARVWDLSFSRDPLVLTGHTGGIAALEFSPASPGDTGGRWLVTTSEGESNDRTARVWDMRDPAAAPRVLAGHTSGISAVAFSPDGQWLATGGQWPDNTIRVWSMRDAAALPIIWTGHASGISDMTFSSDGRWLITASALDGDNTIRMWDMRAPNAAPLVLSGHDEIINAIAITPDARWLVSASDDQGVRVWDLNEPTAAPDPIALAAHEGRALAVAFRGTRWLVTAGADRAVRLWDMNDLATPPLVLRGHTGEVNVVALSPDGRWLASGDSEGEVRVWQLGDLAAEPVVLNGPGSFWGLAFSPDSRRLAAGGYGNDIFMWSVDDWAAAPTRWVGHENAIFAITFSPDNRWLIGGSFDNTARVWDLGRPAVPPTVLSGHRGTVSALAVSSDSRRLATGSWDTDVRVWDLNNLALAPLVLSGHENGISGLAFSPDDRWLATVAGDKTARMWDMENSAPPVVLSSHAAILSGVAFSPDMHWLATAGWDGRVMLWNLHLDELIDEACQAVRRNLTPGEWEQYLPGQPYHRTCPGFPPGE